MISAIIFRSPFFWFLVFLLLAEFTATMVNPYRETPAASEVARNPLPLRGWPEFLRAGDDSHNAINLAIISNSQGAGKEIGLPENIYSALLEQDFRKAGQDINIENWSLSGLRTDQVELLSMVASQRQIDLLVIITGIKSLDVVGSTRLGANSDDLDLVAGKTVLWPGIMSSRVLQKTTWDDLLLRYLTLGSDIVRIRPYLLDLLAEKIPPAAHTLAFGHRRSQHALDTVNRTDQVKENPPAINVVRKPPPSAMSTTSATWDKQFRRSRLPTFQALFPGLNERLSSNGTKLLWIWMPIYPAANTAILRKGAAPVYSIICDEIIADGANCLDLTNSLPADAFITLSASSHLNLKGQKAMSHLLYPLIDNALH